MSNLLLYFALPLATIILAGIFETFIKCPFKVAGIAFSIYLVATFALGAPMQLIVVTIAYTILALLVAIAVMFIQNDNDGCGNFPRGNTCRGRR